jgi:hypothetical protein
VLAPESTISRYRLTADEYREWIVYTVRNVLDEPGISNEAATVTSHCSPAARKGGRIVFEPTGEEGVVLRFDETGFTATAAGRFVDHWRTLR